METDFKKQPREFYRIEYKDGYGLHNAVDEDGCYFINELPLLRDRHNRLLPNMISDTIIAQTYLDNSVWRFCFNSMDDLHRLVLDNEIEDLKKYGFKVYKIVADCYVISPYQAIININNIISKEEIL